MCFLLYRTNPINKLKIHFIALPAPIRPDLCLIYYNLLVNDFNIIINYYYLLANEEL